MTHTLHRRHVRCPQEIKQASNTRKLEAKKMKIEKKTIYTVSNVSNKIWLKKKYNSGSVDFVPNSHSYQTVEGWKQILGSWICWSCKLLSAGLSVPDLLFQRLSNSFGSSNLHTLLTTGKGGSISSMLLLKTTLLLRHFWFLGISETSWCLDLQLEKVVVAVVVFGVLIIKFLPEKSFLSLEYLTIGEEVVFLLVLSVLVVKVSLWEGGMPLILLFLLTWPIQLILGDKGSLPEEAEGSLNRGRVTSLMEGLEQSIGRNVLFW